MDIRCTAQTASWTQVRVTTSSPSEIRGVIRGPFCSFARTLPGNYPIRRGVAEVVDPCYWTPNMPFRYEIKLAVEYEHGEQRQEEFLWGLRWCLPHKTDLRLNGKRHVVRGLAIDHADVDLWELRRLASALVTPVTDAKFLDKASEVGVCILVDAAPQDASALRSCQLFPAVHFIKDGAAMGNVLSVSSREDVPAELHWIQDTKMPPAAQRPRPTLVVRETTLVSPADMRRECDELQKDMAQFGQFAGYLVQSASSS